MNLHVPGIFQVTSAAILIHESVNEENVTLAVAKYNAIQGFRDPITSILQCSYRKL